MFRKDGKENVGERERRSWGGCGLESGREFNEGIKDENG